MYALSGSAGSLERAGSKVHPICFGDATTRDLPSALLSGRFSAALSEQPAPKACAGIQQMCIGTGD
eukprot:5354212-Prymnesium_polylepis.6